MRQSVRQRSRQLSQFEYVSVAVALIYALVVGRLLTGLAVGLEDGRR